MEEFFLKITGRFAAPFRIVLAEVTVNTHAHTHTHTFFLSLSSTLSRTHSCGKNPGSLRVTGHWFDPPVSDSVLKCPHLCGAGLENKRVAT